MPGALRRLRQARERRRAAAAGRHRRRARRRRLARSRLLRGDLRAAAVSPRSARRPRRLGLRAAGPGQRRRARRDAGVRPPLARAPPHHARRVRRGRRAAARPDGQLGGRPPHDRLGSRARPGSDARQPRDPRRQPASRTRRSSAPSAGARARRRRPPARPRLAWRRPLAHRPPARAARARQSAGHGRPDVDPCVHRRPRCLAARRRRRPGDAPAERLATVVGRYYAMDRDERWDRTERALAAIMVGEGQHASDPVGAVRAAYEAGVTDEFIEPVVLGDRPRLGPARTRRSSSTSGPTEAGSCRAARRCGRRPDHDDGLP